MDTKLNLNIGTFNIQNLSLKKISNEFIFEKIIEIIKFYDILFILELSGKENDIKQILNKLINKLNKDQNQYSFIHSQKTGLTKGSAEFIGCIYRSDYGFVLDEYVLESKIITEINNQLNSNSDSNSDSNSNSNSNSNLTLDIFDRQPFIVKLNHKPIFFIVNHISPKNVINELNALNVLFNNLYNNDPNAYYFLLGDYNADGSYLNKKESISVKLFTNEKLCSLTNNEITNLSKSLKKYDRILCSMNLLEHNLLNNVDSDTDNYNRFSNTDKYYFRIKIYDCMYEQTIKSIKDLADKYPSNDPDIKYLYAGSEYLEQLIINRCKKISDHYPLYCNLRLDH